MRVLETVCYCWRCLSPSARRFPLRCVYLSIANAHCGAVHLRWDEQLAELAHGVLACTDACSCPGASTSLGVRVLNLISSHGQVDAVMNQPASLRVTCACCVLPCAVRCAGGFVIRGRVNACLNVSRALGDKPFKLVSMLGSSICHKASLGSSDLEQQRPAVKTPLFPYHYFSITFD